MFLIKNKMIYTILIVLLVVVCVQERRNSIFKDKYLGQKPTGMLPEIFAPGMISNAGFHLHSCVAFSPDGDEIYFTHMVFKPERLGTIYSVKWENGQWTRPRVASFSGLFTDDSPTFSSDGQKLYFTSNRPVHENDQTDDLNFWYVTRTDSGWSDAVYGGDVLNSDYCDFRLSFSKKGTVYLSSDRDHQDGRTFDIFKSRLDHNGYSSPKIMDQAITTPITEQICFISPDESYMVFYRYTRNNPDGVGLYISFRQKDGSWTEGKNMGPMFNAPVEKVTQDASLSPDGKTIFFLRRYEEAIYWVDAGVIDDLKPDHIKKEIK